jgi:hypothetical protein
LISRRCPPSPASTTSRSKWTIVQSTAAFGSDFPHPSCHTVPPSSWNLNMFSVYIHVSAFFSYYSSFAYLHTRAQKIHLCLYWHCGVSTRQPFFVVNISVRIVGPHNSQVPVNIFFRIPNRKGDPTMAKEQGKVSEYKSFRIRGYSIQKRIPKFSGQPQRLY